jgi:hypothetical protein
MIWFDRQAARELSTTFELRVRLRREVPLTVRVAGGRLRIRPGAPSQAGAIVTIGSGDLLRLVLGMASWPQLLAAGRLELAGDPFLALRFPGLFKLPAATKR